MTVLIFAARAASTFSFTPPIGSTSPRSVTSPVMATLRFTGRPVSTEMIARGDGDAGGRAVLRNRPCRNVDVDVVRLEVIGGNALLVGMRARVRERRLRRLLHHVAELAGQ